MSTSDTTRDPLELLLSEYLERIRAGEEMDLDQFANEHPDLSTEIRDLFPTLMALENVRGGEDSPGATIDEQRIESGLQLGEYQLVREIGIGGMGIVYEAIQQSVQRRVALKVLPTEFSKQPDRKERFMQEARTVARLSYKNIVPIIDYGQSNDRCYFAMRLIEGVGLDWVVLRRNQDPEPLTSNEVLDQFQQQGVPLIGNETDEEDDEDSLAFEVDMSSMGSQPRKNQGVKWVLKNESWKQIARIGIQAARALEHAHNLGVLHRDIKPGNLLLDHEGMIWVTDFGLAKSEKELSITGANDVVGTLRYISPERFHGQVDARSDLYALGLTLIELCINRPAFSPSNRTELMRSIMEGDVLSPRKVNPRFPPDLEAILLKATARQPVQRYQSAGELIQDLRRFVRGHQIESIKPISKQKLELQPWKWGLIALIVVCLAQFFVIANYRALFPYLIVQGVTLTDYQQSLNHRLNSLDQVYEQLMQRPLQQDLYERETLAAATNSQIPVLQQTQLLYIQLQQDAEKFQQPELAQSIQARIDLIDQLLQ